MAVPDLSSPATHPVPAVPATQTPAPKQIYLRVTPPTANSEEAIFDVRDHCEALAGGYTSVMCCFTWS